MKIIELTALENGAHRNQNAPLAVVPAGWALIPEELAVPETFPFVDVSAQEIAGVMTVTALSPGIVPPEEPEASEES